MTREYQHEMGPGGNCICPKCEKVMPHERGTPCQEQRCPRCNAKLLREGSQHHKLYLAKHGKLQDNNEA